MGDKKESVSSLKDIKRLTAGGQGGLQPIGTQRRQSPYLGLSPQKKYKRTPEFSESQNEKKGQLLRELEVELTKREQGLEQREYKLKFEAGQLRSGSEKLTQRRDTFAKELRELRQLRHDADKYEAKLADLERQAVALGKRKTRVVAAEASVRREKDAAKKLRADIKGVQQLLNTSQQDLKKARRKIGSLTRARDQLLEQVRESSGFDELVEWAIENGCKSANPFANGVVIVGSDPIDETDLSNFFIDRGIDVYEVDAEGVECMIVGRNGWAEEQLEMQVAAQQGQTLRVYSQEMALTCLISGSDIFDVEDAAFLDEQAEGHPALTFLKEGELQWPLTVVSEIPKTFHPFPAGQDRYDIEESPLKKLGYTVGITNGLPANDRKNLLQKAYLGELQRVHSDEYMKDWGQPRTRLRLWRIAHHLAWLARSKRSNRSFETAVSHWSNDLRALEKQYFKPWMRFAWPQVRVPGSRD